MSVPTSFSGAAPAEAAYPLTARRTAACRLLGLLPPAWREALAETFLRRAGSPGPAAEHVIQHLLSAARKRRRERREAVVARGADLFYAHQYRQFLNPAMAAFATTATRVLAAAGGERQGRWWHRIRRPRAAMLDPAGPAMPILVLSRQVVALSLLLPKAKRAGEPLAVARWFAGQGPMPGYYRSLVAGERLRCVTAGAEARETSREGALLEMTEAVLSSRRLALLALHPCDTDAMGLHITLFDVQARSAEQLQAEYGLDETVLADHVAAAERSGRLLIFLVGATEEAFTQCSQNLFVKRPATSSGRVSPSRGWNPELPVEHLLETQFESLQVTVAAGGMPGVSPRNGDVGKAVFLGREGRRSYLLIPYHPGNAVHGHAAKLWSNPYGTVVVYDDHASLSCVTFSGRCRSLSHRRIRKRFPAIADRVMSQTGRDGKPIPEPEYWFLQRVEQITVQREALQPYRLSPARGTCSIAAGGRALHNKKPGYFAADSLPAYDLRLQHQREAAGRPVDPAGTEYARWRVELRDALAARRDHLAAGVEA